MNRINIQEWLDFDYLDKLSDDEKKWLSQFCNEYYSADFRNKTVMHKSKKKKREIYNNNNARNRDTTSLLKAYRMLDDVEKSNLKYNGEDELVELLDLSKKLGKKS